MSQEDGKWIVNGLFRLLINGIYEDYNPLTNLLLTSWDIQEGVFVYQFLRSFCSFLDGILGAYLAE